MKTSSDCQYEIVGDLLSKTNANEVSEVLTHILDAYISNSPDDPFRKANTVTLSNEIIRFFFNLEMQHTGKGNIENIEQPPKKVLESCSHN